MTKNIVNFFKMRLNALTTFLKSTLLT